VKFEFKDPIQTNLLLALVFIWTPCAVIVARKWAALYYRLVYGFWPW